MAPLTSDQEIVEQVLRETADFYPGGKERNVLAFDRTNGQYVLLREGWEGYKRQHYAWIHIELRDGKFWVHRDGTEEGVTNDLFKAGIPKERIVLAFQHPVRRERSEFAVA